MFSFIRFAVSSILLLTATGQASADNEQTMPPIRRLFGVELGTRVTEYKGLGEAVVESGIRPAPEWIQPIAPPEPNSLFTSYKVRFNPVTREIYEISAQSLMSREECKATVPLLAKVLKQQYAGYKFIELDGAFIIDSRTPEDRYFPYQINCTSDRMLIWLIDEKALMSHLKQNKDRSPVSAKGL